jgi:hypothetical protein
MTATIKRIATRWTLPALVLIAGGFVCDGLTEVGHHAFLVVGGIALGIGIGRESRVCAHDSEIRFNVIEAEGGSRCNHRRSHQSGPALIMTQHYA